MIPPYSRFRLNQLPGTGADLLSLYAAVNAISRVLVGLVSDRVGRTNSLFFCTFMCGVSCLAIWSVASTVGIMALFVSFYGFFSGG